MLKELHVTEQSTAKYDVLSLLCCSFDYLYRIWSMDCRIGSGAFIGMYDYAIHGMLGSLWVHIHACAEDGN